MILRFLSERQNPNHARFKWLVARLSLKFSEEFQGRDTGLRAITRAAMLTIRDLTYRIAGRTLIDGASAQINAGWKVGLVGRNGAGKSTLL
ncbi:MAG TPA: ATP-binding cassette domain-containing protein, partial [Stellaceae bacterium]|nr:ATP-binding cassette domain-containing protein [Stellaceae bacterium]